MKGMISFETAQILKIAKFPQPVPENGQYWYDQNGKGPILIREIEGVLWVCDPETRKEKYLFDEGPVTGKDAFYAPTKRDLLTGLPEKYRNLDPRPVKKLKDGGIVDDVDWYAERWIEENCDPEGPDGVEWLDLKV